MRPPRSPNSVGAMNNYGENEYWAEPYTAEVDQLDLVNMGQYNVQEAKTRLSELLNLVERGEDVVIAEGWPASGPAGEN